MSSLISTLLVVGVAALSCTACGRSRSTSGPPAASAASAASRPAPAAPLERPAPATLAEAVEVLRAADAFEDTHVGFSGSLSQYVAAFRVVLADPGAKEAFHALVDRATTAGRLYGAAGLYLVDPPAFDSALARIRADGGDVTTRTGCFTQNEPVAVVIRSPERKRIELAEGETIASWFASHPGGGHAADLAGGYMPLSFAEQGRAAPRPPAR